MWYLIDSWKLLSENLQPPLKKSTPPFLLTPSLKIQKVQVPSFLQTLYIFQAPVQKGGDTMAAIWIIFLQAKYLTRNTQAKSVDAIKQLDDLLVQLGVRIYFSWKQTWMNNNLFQDYKRTGKSAAQKSFLLVVFPKLWRIFPACSLSLLRIFCFQIIMPNILTILCMVSKHKLNYFLFDKDGIVIELRRTIVWSKKG